VAPHPNFVPVRPVGAQHPQQHALVIHRHFVGLPLRVNAIARSIEVLLPLPHTASRRCQRSPPPKPARGDTEANSASNTTTKLAAEGDTKASAADAAGVSPRYRPTTANPSRAGDTEATSASNTTTKLAAEGDTKASTADAAGVSRANRCAPNQVSAPRSHN